MLNMHKLFNRFYRKVIYIILRIYVVYTKINSDSNTNPVEILKPNSVYNSNQFS